MDQSDIMTAAFEGKVSKKRWLAEFLVFAAVIAAVVFILVALAPQN